ncbi:hypothetical protein [Streptomyces sp. NPDC046862]
MKTAYDIGQLGTALGDLIGNERFGKIVISRRGGLALRRSRPEGVSH